MKSPNYKTFEKIGEIKMINKENKKRIWPIVLILFICVAATTFTLMNRQDLFMEDETGAVELAPADSDAASAEVAETSDDTYGVVQPRYSFEASDSDKKWSMETDVEIFNVSYVDGEENISVLSGNGDKVIAPGTDGSYTFKLKNTGDTPISYTMTMDAFCTPNGIEIPIEGRVHRYDNKWIAGSNDDYADVTAMDAVTDSDTLGAGKYTYYIFEWQWPFESDDDEHDTFLGNMAVDEDVTFTVKIKTVATVDADGYGENGIIINTGDDNNILLWGMLIIFSGLLILLLLFGRREKDEEEC